MRFPWVSRAHHEQTVTFLRKQIEGLARTLYAGNVPEEMQLMLGISIPVSQVAQVNVEPASEPPQSTEEELAEEHRRDLAEMTSRARTRPSTLPAFMQRVMEKRLVQRAKAAVTKDAPAMPMTADNIREFWDGGKKKNPQVAARFEAIKSDVLKSKSIH